MKSSIFLVATTVVVLAATFWASDTRSHDGKSPTAGQDVVMVRCNPLAFTISAYQGSPSTPSRKSTSCPEQLSMLLKDGYGIVDIGHFDARDQQSIVYTLSK